MKQDDRLHAYVTSELMRNRPSRAYDDDGWKQDVEHRIAMRIEPSKAQLKAAHDYVVASEKKSRAKVRQWLADQDLTDGPTHFDISWFVFQDFPIYYKEERIGPDEKPYYVGITVALRAMTPTDWVSFAEWGEQEAQRRFDAEMRAYSVARKFGAAQSGSSFAAWAARVRPLGQSESA